MIGLSKNFFLLIVEYIRSPIWQDNIYTRARVWLFDTDGMYRSTHNNRVDNCLINIISLGKKISKRFFYLTQ